MAEQLDDLRLLCAVLPVGAAELRLAAQLGEEHRLSFYDATYAAVSQLRSAMLATADKELLGCGAGEPSSAVAARAGL